MRDQSWTRRDAVQVIVVSSLGLVLAPLLGCNPDRAPVPPEIAIGADVCDWCRMTIDDAGLAAAFVQASGPPLRFGEPGCLLAWLAENRGREGTPFVVAREDGAWLLASAARYARGAVRTPMAFDLAAWRRDPGSGTPVSWTRLLEEGAPRATRG